MQTQKIFLAILPALALIFSAGCNNSSDSNLARNSGPLNGMISSIQYSDDELSTRYGAYSETHFALVPAQPVAIQWNVIEAALPPGLNLANNGNAATLYGTAAFTGTWCFTLAASGAGQGIAAQEICMNSDNNNALPHPRFNRNSGLSISANQFIQENIRVISRGSAISGTVLADSLPNGINIAFNPAAVSFVASGRTENAGDYRFVLRIVDNFYRENYQQFQLAVIDERDDYECAPGYSYDSNAGYCVQNRANACPAGTYFDPQNNSCSPFPTSPVVRCGPNQNFDPFLQRCVDQRFPRCPNGTRYDPRARRCEREMHRCAPGYKYDFFRKECGLQDPQRRR